MRALPAGVLAVDHGEMRLAGQRNDVVEVFKGEVKGADHQRFFFGRRLWACSLLVAQRQLPGS